MQKVVEVKTNILASVIATYVLVGISVPTLAQSSEDAAAMTADGYRGSLSRAMSVKRDALGVVEVISSESPGEVPGSNLSEALQRISGVAIDRKDGEGWGVNIRGIDQELNLVTVNDRKMPTVSNSEAPGRATRGFDIGSLTGVGVERVEVYKTGRADRSVGGLGATINVKTLRPFDIDGSTAAVGVKAATDASLGDGNGDKYTPETSGLFSWANDEKTLGATLVGSYQKRDFTLKQATATEFDRVDFAEIYTVDKVGDASRVRQNAQATLQYRPINHLTATVDYLYLNNDINASLDQHYEYGNRYYDHDDAVTEAAEQIGSADIRSIGFNLGYEVNSDFTVAMDYHDSTATGRNDQYSSRVRSNVYFRSDTQASSSLGLQGVDIKQSRLNGSYHLGALGFFSDSTVTIGAEAREEGSNSKHFGGGISIDDTIQEALRIVRSTSTGIFDDRTVEESVSGGFVQFTSAIDVVGMPAHFMAGVHVEKTDVTSSSNRYHPSTIDRSGDGEFSLHNTSEATDYVQRASYTNTLPNLDIDLAITDNIKTRFSLSKTIGRASYDILQPEALLDINFDLHAYYAVARGNPALEPYESKNVDASVEWYFKESSYVSLGYFRKDLSNLAGSGFELKEFYGLRDMTLGANYAERIANSAGMTITTESTDPYIQFDTILPLNNRDATIDGLEFSLQYLFDETGFGVSTNFTKVNSKREPENNAVDTPLALPGASDSANLAAFFESDKWHTQVTYNWRDKYLGGVYNSGPKYVADYTEVSCSLGYRATKSLLVKMEAFNIAGEDQRQYGGGNALVEDLNEFSARYNIGMRYVF